MAKPQRKIEIALDTSVVSYPPAVAELTALCRKLAANGNYVDAGVFEGLATTAGNLKLHVGEALKCFPDSAVLRRLAELL